MCWVAGELCNGMHVHPMHSIPYIQNRLLPNVELGAKKSGRTRADIDLIIPVFAIPGDSPEERENMTRRARTQIAFYGSTPNYAFQFDDLGFEGTTENLGRLMKEGNIQGMADAISYMLSHFAVTAKWNDIADKLLARYRGVASRVVTYLAAEDIQKHPDHVENWGAIAKAVRG